MDGGIGELPRHLLINHACREAIHIVANVRWRQQTQTFSIGSEGFLPAFRSVIVLPHDLPRKV